MANLNLIGTSGQDTLTGGDGDDTICGNGGTDTLEGKGGDDAVTQTAAQLNAAAGSLLDGGDGHDTIVFDGSQAYTTSYVKIIGGAGNDTIEVATKPGQYVGSIQVDGGTGDDTITVGGNIQGGERGLGYIDGGSGNDRIEVLEAANGIGVWGNRAFSFRGGAGDDTFVLGGTQVAYSAATTASLEGGGGFDTLVWNGSYNLTVGGHQNPAAGLYNGRYAQQVRAANVERLDLASSGAEGLALVFTAADVAAITAGSDFERASLGLGHTGTGKMLFVDPGANTIDLAQWTLIGLADANGGQYRVYQDGDALLAVREGFPRSLDGTAAADALTGTAGDDAIFGADGADTLKGGAGDDVIVQTSAALNSAGGTVLDGGDGDDTLIFDGSQAYSASFVRFSGGAGADRLEIATEPGQFAGSIQADGGAGDDSILVGGNIQGGSGGYIDGGEGNDAIEILRDANGISIWGNRNFEVRGGAGDDRFVFDGALINVTSAPRVDGGRGFDTLVWNGQFNLTAGGSQIPTLAPYAGQYAREARFANIERIDLASGGATGLEIVLSPGDVAQITDGSDFDWASLGLGLSGSGKALFVNLGQNTIDLTGWTAIGSASVGQSTYAIHRSAEGEILGIADATARSLIGTEASQTLAGLDGNDSISGGGGADTLIGGAGDDAITQTAAQLNAAAGSLLDGGDGHDTIVFDGSQAYTTSYVKIIGGAGNDTIEVATKPGQYVGSVQVDGGTGDDTITVGGNIQGGERGLGYIDGGSGNDRIEVLEAANGIGVWGNRAFSFRGGAGDDTFVLGGTQVAYSAATTASLEGGGGFDTLVWNGSYNVTIGGHQNAALTLFDGRLAREIGARNIERLDLASSGASGLTIAVSAADVSAITAGSDFQRADLGLGFTGLGNVLLIDAGDNTIDLTGWDSVGLSDPVAGSAYNIYSNGTALIGIRYTHGFEKIAFGGTNILADLDGDGTFDDIPFEQTQTCCLRCLMGENDGVATNSDATTVTVFDVNNDGVVELYRSVYNSPFVSDGYAQLYFQDGEGNWVRSEEFAALEIRGHIEQGTPFDYDNDGDLDLFLPRYAIDNWDTPDIVDYEPGSLLLRNDDGRFVDVTLTTPLASDSAADLTYFTDNRQPEGVVPVDIDSDGLVDLYTSGHMLLNKLENGFVDANASFNLHGEFDEGISINDFNNDGILDLVRLDPLSGPTLLRGTANGFVVVENGFRGEADYTNKAGAGSWGMATIDLNSDGLLDIVINGTSEGDAKFFLNGGTYFSRVDSFVNFARGNSISVGDIDRNGSQDFSLIGVGSFVNTITPVNGSIRVGLFGENGEHNQVGRVISLASVDQPDTIQLALVTIASGYHAQNDYTHSVPLAETGLYRIGHSPTSPEQSGHSQLDMTASAGWSISLYASRTGPTRIEAIQDGSLARGADQGTRADLYAGAGDDLVVLRVPELNGAAGTVLDGGDGDDTLIFEGSQAYTTNYVRLFGGAGADRIEVATGAGQIAGAVQVEGGAGDDAITIGGNIQGGERGLGYIDGGSGNDFIEVLGAANGVGVWGNRPFQFRGGAGDDTIVMGGTQIAYSAATAAQLDGGSGFDTLVWNGSYNLTHGGHQNPALELYNGTLARDVQLANFERLDLASAGVSGLDLVLTAEDVASITAGSDFDQATLGLGLAGTGNTLFVDAGENTLDLAGWNEVGLANVSGTQYRVFASESSYLALAEPSVEKADASSQEAATFTTQALLADPDEGDTGGAFSALDFPELAGHDQASLEFNWGELHHVGDPRWSYPLMQPDWLV